MFWGYCHAMDLLAKYKLEHNLEGKKEINILIAASSDIRHILKTLAKYYTHEDAKNLTINFYVYDLFLEFYAREMLFLLIALEPTEKLGLSEKAGLFLEFHGNTLLRPTTAVYIKKKACQFIKMLTDKEYQLKRLPCLDLELLKYKEKDIMENIFRFWIKNEYNMAKNWDNRLRHELGVRYDARNGVFDWDYYMVLKEIKDGDRIHVREYKTWRETGIAFNWFEKEYRVSNPSLSIGITADGDQLISLNYLGDTKAGPFFCFCTESEDNGMFEKMNGTNFKRSTDIAERNLMRMFHEIENNNEFIQKDDDNKNLGLILSEIPKINLDVQHVEIEITQEKEDYPALPIKHKIIFLPTNALEDEAKLLKYHRFFDLAFIGQYLVKAINKKVISMVKNKGLILFETKKFVLCDENESKIFREEIEKIMKESDCIGKKENSFKKSTFVTFQINLDRSQGEPDERIAEEDQPKEIASANKPSGDY